MFVRTYRYAGSKYLIKIHRVASQIFVQNPLLRKRPPCRGGLPPGQNVNFAKDFSSIRPLIMVLRTSRCAGSKDRRKLGIGGYPHFRPRTIIKGRTSVLPPLGGGRPPFLRWSRGGQMLVLPLIMVLDQK